MTETNIVLDMRIRAEEAAAIAASRFGKYLDFSTSSLEQLEGILSRLHDALNLSVGQKDLEQSPLRAGVQHMAILYGAYLGETFRRRWGGNWLPNGTDGQAEPTLQIGNLSLSPISRVNKRIVHGPSENVWAYAKVLEEELTRANRGASPGRSDILRDTVP
jgi:hypothetical protein